MDLNDASIQVRMSRKTLAMLAMWFCENGDRPRSLGELARNSMEVLKDLLLEKKLIVPIRETAEATRALEAIGLGNLVIRSKNRGSGLRNYLKQIETDQLTNTLGDPFGPVKIKARKVEKSIEEEIEEAAKAFVDKDRELEKALASVPEGAIVEEE